MSINDPGTTGANTEARGETGGVLPAAAEQKLKDDSSALLETARSELQGLKEEVVTQAGAVAEEAKSELGKIADKAKDVATEQKEFVSGQIEGVAEAVQKVAGELEATDASTASYARIVADTVTRFSDTVKNKDVDELLALTQDFGRKQPVAFMGAAALLGFAASRFLLSSAHRTQSDRHGPAVQDGSTGVGDGGISSNYRSSQPIDDLGGIR